MTKILLSLLTIVLAAGVAIGASGAWFRDTETTTGNTFTAGIIDLEVDCNGDTVFSPMDEPLPLIFEYLPPKDIKPGFSGEVTLSMHLKAGSNNADLWMDILNLQNFGGDNPDREQEVEAASGVDDDISVHILTKVWLDQGSIVGWQNDPAIDPEEGNNIYDVGEPLYYDGNLAGLAAQGNFTVKQNANASTAYYIGWSWSLPTTVGNEHQGDYCTFDIVFGADQVTTYNLTTNVSPPGAGSTTGDGTYDANTKAIITAIESNPCWHFVGWDGEDIDNPNLAVTQVLIDEDKTVTANFARNQYVLTVDASPAEGGTVTGAGTYDCGSYADITATPGNCYEFTGWTGEDITNPDGNETTVLIDGTKTVTAHFTKIQYELTTSSTDGGNVTTPGEPGPYTYDCGDSVNLVAQADSCYEFINWTGSGVDAGKVGNVTNPVTTITMDNDYSVQANFAKYQYTLGTTVNGTGNITLTPPGGTYDCGTVVSVTASTNNPCWHFTGWSQDLTGSVTPQDITMDGNKNVTANFAKYQYDLTVNAGTGGTTDPSGTSSRECGSDVSVSATPDSCYQFTGWTGDVPSGHENDNPVSIHMDGAKTINATFAKISYNLTVNAGTGGSTDPSGTASRECGSDVSVSANPDSCYQFTGWTGDVPSGHESDNPVSIHMDSAKTITATFAKISYNLTVNAGTGGSTDPSGTASRECGSDVSVSANPDSGYEFDYWSGDVPGGHENDNPVSIHMDGVKTITANFVASAMCPAEPSVYNYVGVTTSTNDIYAYKSDVDQFPFAGDAGNRNDYVEATNSQYTAISADDSSRWTLPDPGSDDENFLWLLMKVDEPITSITQIDLKFIGHTTGGTTTHTIYVLKTGADWTQDASWVQVVSGSIGSSSDGTVTGSITSNFADYIDPSTGAITWGVYETRSSEDTLVDYVEMTVSYKVPCQCTYYETNVPWSATSADTWVTKDLSAFVPPNAVCEVVVQNTRSSSSDYYPYYGGVRAVGSSIDRRAYLNSVTSDGGTNSISMYVQADSLSRIQYYADSTSYINFILVGYWPCGTYVEKWNSFTASASGSWRDVNLSGYGVGANQVAEIVMTNDNNADPKYAGVRANGSTNDRRVQLASTFATSSATSYVAATMLVNTDSSSLIEVYAETSSDQTFYLAGYWSSTPWVYTERINSTTSIPTADNTWQNWTISGSPWNVPANAVAEVLLGNRHDNNNDMGIRSDGSTLSRYVDLCAADGGGNSIVRMHTNVGASSITEVYYEDVSDPHTFYLVGYWTKP